MLLICSDRCLRPPRNEDSAHDEHRQTPSRWPSGPDLRLGDSMVTNSSYISLEKIHKCQVAEGPALKLVEVRSSGVEGQI